MKKRIDAFYDRIFKQVLPIPVGIYHFQTPPDSPKQYRLHLRLDECGEGILILNARTVLHLNQTATEYAYHIIKQTPPDQIASEMKRRYNVSKQKTQQDFADFYKQITTLVETPELDPDIYIDLSRIDPYSKDISAPYRLDCALTYKTSSQEGKNVAPSERVKRELTTDEWRTILGKAWQAGIPHVVFTGGEPTLRPDLLDLIAYAEQLGQVSGILTDGLRLAETKFLHQLLQSGLDHIMLLLDDNDERAWEAIRDVIAEDIHLTVHLTITKSNMKKAGEILDRLLKMDVKTLSLSISETSLKDEIKKTQQLAADKGLTLVWDLPVPYSGFHPIALELEEHEKPSQGAGKAWLYVEPDGDVLPEQGINKVLGNLLTDEWSSIWEKARSS
jgi:organic radical activating enzyme